MVALSEDPDLRDKIDLLRASYKEVLEATEHQDEKIGRFLTAVAFLIIAAITLGSRGDVLNVAYQLQQPPAKPVRLPAYLLVVFLCLILVTLVLLVTGLGARLSRPSSDRSRLFFLLIAAMSSQGWDRAWSWDSRTIGRSLTTEYLGEIRNIAQRVTRKYGRTFAAGIFLQAATLCLILATVLGFLADAFPKTDGGSFIDWSAFMPRLLASSVLGAFGLAVVLDRTMDLWRSKGRLRVAFVIVLLGLAAAGPALVLFSRSLSAYDVAGISAIVALLILSRLIGFRERS